MGYLLFALREILPVALLLLPFYLLMHTTRFQDLRRTLTGYLFSIYLCAVYALVGLPNVTYVRFELNLNWIPFAGFLNGLRDYMLNVLLFVPLGVFLPFFSGKFREAKNTVLAGAGISLIIELLQIFTYRATDVNDLITNTLGTVLGFLLGKCLWKIPPFTLSWKTNDLGIVFGSAICAMFFLQPVLAALL